MSFYETLDMPIKVRHRFTEISSGAEEKPERFVIIVVFSPVFNGRDDRSPVLSYFRFCFAQNGG